VSDEDTIRPVAIPEHLENAAPLKESDFYSRCVYFLALLVGLSAVIMSAIAFAGFAENDQNITHLLSAFVMSFGIGALAYGPMGLIAFYARKAIHAPLPRLRAIVVVLLMLPWIGLGYFVFKIGGSWRYAAIIGVLTALFILFWAARFLKAR